MPRIVLTVDGETVYDSGAAAAADPYTGVNATGATLNPGGGGKKSKKEKKAKGTRKLSPYMKFAQEARKNILAEDPSLKSDIIAVGKKIGEKWRALSDAEKARY